MIPSSPCGPSCVSGGDYTADRAHSDATKRQRERGNKTLGEKRKTGQQWDVFAQEGRHPKKADIPRRAAPLMSSLWDTPKLAARHRERLESLQGQLERFTNTHTHTDTHTHTHTREKHGHPKSVTIFPGM